MQHNFKDYESSDIISRFTAEVFEESIEVCDIEESEILLYEV